jgi:hypothetical protein
MTVAAVRRASRRWCAATQRPRGAPRRETWIVRSVEWSATTTGRLAARAARRPYRLGSQFVQCTSSARRASLVRFGSVLSRARGPTAPRLTTRTPARRRGSIGASTRPRATIVTSSPREARPRARCATCHSAPPVPRFESTSRMRWASPRYTRRALRTIAPFRDWELRLRTSVPAMGAERSRLLGGASRSRRRGPGLRLTAAPCGTLFLRVRLDDMSPTRCLGFPPD